MDTRLKQLSYSSRLLLHECPRKFQLQKLNTEIEDLVDDDDSNITFQFGHSVGDGVAELFAGVPIGNVIWGTFLRWKLDLFSEDARRGKSFALAIIALQKLAALRNAGFLKEYELVYYKDKPAVELGFRIHCPGGFKYRGFVDVVLRHKITGEVLVLEVKTSSGQVIANSFKNSAQAIGYSIVLDVLFPLLSSYKVLYLIYKTKQLEYEPISYSKSYLQRALWIQELLLDIDIIQMYEKAGVYPMHGQNCISRFYKECKYLGVCTLSTDKITSPMNAAFQKKLDEETYVAELTLAELIQHQLAKAGDIDETIGAYTPTEADQIL